MHNKSKLLIGATAIALTLTGCHKKATGQVVAVVNGEEISQQELNAELQGAAIPPSADKKKIMALLLQRVIDRKLLVQKADKDGLGKSPEYVEQVRRMQEGLLVQALERNAAKSVALPDGTEVNQYIAAHPTLFAGRKRYTLDQISFARPADPALLKKLEPAHSIEAVGAVLSAAGVSFTRGDTVLDTGRISPEAAARVAGLPAGEPFIVPGNGGFVVSVIKSVSADPTPDNLAKPAATNLIRQQSVSDAMRKQLDAARSAAKIEYQPGFEPPAKTAASPAPAAPATAAAT